MFKYFTFTILLTAFFCLANAQSVVIVEPDELGTTNNLLEAIEAQANPSSVIFELSRDGFYEMSNTILYSGSRLHIRSAAGEGEMPILALGVDEQGDSFNNMFEIVGQGTHFILENLYLTGENVDGSITKNIIRISANDVKLEVRSCYVEREDQSFFRFNNPGGSIFITNSILRNLGNNIKPNNGRLFDSRGNAMDSIYLENNTIYNLAHHLIGHKGGLGGTPLVQYVKFNHNTVYNCGQVPVNLARAMEAEVTNNLIINSNFFGNVREWDDIQQTVFRVDSLGIINEMGTIGDETQRDIVIQNNAYYRDPIFPSIITGTIDSVSEVNNPLFNSVAQELIAVGIIDTANVFEENVTFKNVPNNIPDYLTSFLQNQGIADDQVLSFFAYENENVENTLGVPPADVAFDFSFDAESRAFTAAAGGEPLGDPRWEGFVVSSTRPVRISEDESLSLYPNPVTDILTLALDLDQSGEISVQIFDLMGKEVLSLYPANTISGQTQRQIDLSRLTQGTYVAKITFTTDSGKEKIYADIIVKQ